MRWDDIGLWWEDIPTVRGKSNIQRPRPSVPETGWRAPETFPNLSSAVLISFDVETWDPELLQSGPGWARGVGHIVGIAIGALAANGAIGKWYFPIRHEDTPEDNLDPETVLNWVKYVLETPTPKCAANGIYDIGWLQEEGIYVQGKVYDIQHAEALLSESANVGLDDQAEKYLGLHKESSLLYKWCSDYFGGKPNDRQRKNIYRSPPSLVGPYAESDAELPIKILQKQWPLLERDGLLNLFDIECRLTPLLVAMRFAGVTIDLGFAEQLYEHMGDERTQMLHELKNIAGFEVNVAAGDSIKKAFDKHGLWYPTSPKTGRASFTAPFLETVEHPLGKKIVEIRQRDKLRNVFIKSYLLDNHVDGKVFCSFNQLRGEKKGTRSGRFSSSDPNLQNIPSRTELGKRIRQAFIHDYGHEAWRKYDYSQIEYRFFAHYAVGPGADGMREQYRVDPDTDYHVQTGLLIKAITGQEIIRAFVKNVNFGLLYGQGEAGLAALLGLPMDEARALFAAYHKGVPFTKATMKATKDEVNELGYITTILGRRTYFDMWEPASYHDRRPALPLEDALEEYGSNIQRAYLNPALNRRLQGSAADMMKVAMLKNWEDGVFDEVGVPRLTVHDELDFSDPGGKDDAFREMRHNLENAMPLSVPIRADYEIGNNWGNVHEVN